MREIDFLLAFLLGMLFNIGSIYYGNYVGVMLAAIILSAIMNVLWVKKPINLIVLASVLAANPANLSTSISLNLIFIAFWFIFHMEAIRTLSTWSLWVLFGAFLSVFTSVVNWQTSGTIFTQLAAITNYLIGPLLLIPLFYSQMKKVHSVTSNAKALLWALVIPSIIYLLSAHTFGDIVIDFTSLFQQYGINVTIYRLGNVNFHLTRTQVGIPLAALSSVCVSFLIAHKSEYRIVAICCIGACIYLFLVTGSWGSILAAMLSVIFVFLLSSFGVRVPLRQSLVIVSFVSAGLIGWEYLPETIQRYFTWRFEQSFVTEMTVFDRIQIWQLSLSYLADNLIGRGWDLWIAPLGIYPHNDYLVYGISFGVICGLMYLLTIVQILILNIKNGKNQTLRWSDPILLAGIAATSVLFINSFFDHLTANRWYYNVVWSIVWFCYYAGQRRRINYHG